MQYAYDFESDHDRRYWHTVEVPKIDDKPDDAQRDGESFDAWQKRINPSTRAKHFATDAATQAKRDRAREQNRAKNKRARAARKANR